MNRVSLVIALAAAGAACSEPTSAPLTQLNLDRPVDISFACFGPMRVTNGRTTPDPNDPIIDTAQPAISCDRRSEEHPSDTPAPVPPGQENVDTTTWIGFILQSAPGTVAIAHWPVGPSRTFTPGTALVDDADELTPGKNAISVGEEPMAIATDKSGCYAVTANAGSCDMSALEISSAVDDDPGTLVKVDRVPVTSSAGVPILARAAAMVAEPNTEIVGNLCPARPEGLMYVAYPSCHLVAAVQMVLDPGDPNNPDDDSTTGRVVAGIRYDDAGGVSITDGNVTCPQECTAENIRPEPILRGPRPVALSLDTATRRLAIGAEGLASVTVVDLDASFLPIAPILQLPLENPSGDLGVTAIAVSPVIGMGDNTDEMVPDQTDDRTTTGGQGQYVYAVATDGTVRVVDILTKQRECDTQIDGRFLRTVEDIPTLQCLPINDPLLPRRRGAKGPGIELIGDTLPLSVAFFRIPRVTARPMSGDTPPQRLDDPRSVLIGSFAILTSTNGSTFVVNVDDDNASDREGDRADRFNDAEELGTQPVLVIPHQLRDAGRYRGATSTPTNLATGDDRGRSLPLCSDAGPADSLVAGARGTTAPTQNLDVGPIATNKVGELPVLRSVTCVEPLNMDGTMRSPPVLPVSEVQFSAPVQVRTEVFPDLRALRANEQWQLTYEGALSLDGGTFTVDGPPVRIARTRVDSTGFHLIDPSKPFCEIGVEPFDFVQLRGCNPASAFACPAGYECFLHPESQLGMGACLLSSEAERLANLCRDFLISGRRYTVNSDPRSGDIVLLPRKHVLRTTPIDGCVDDNQCTLLANYAAHARSDRDPTASPVVQPVPDQDGKLKDVNGHQWSCRVDDARAPVNTEDPARNRRCVQVCVTNDDCNVEDDELNRRFGLSQFKMVCQSGVCMEGITPPQQCVNGPQHYDVHASEAFAVIGTASGYVHPFTVASEVDDHCVRKPDADRLQIGRIPLEAPPCDPTADPITGQLMGGGFEPNPCSTSTETTEIPPPPPDATGCKTGAGPVLVERTTSAIQFRNRGLRLTLVDPTYPGDSQCILDRAGQLGNIPLVYQGYQISFFQAAGYSPLTLTAINPSFPVKVVRGPTQSIWVVDSGDFLSTTIGVASTRGKVYRVEPVSVGTASILQ
jgi:hypothetical protein